MRLRVFNFSFLLLLHFLDVESELGSFENVSVGSSALSWSGRNAGEEFTSVELIGNMLVNDSGLLESFVLSLDVSGLLLGLFFLLLSELNSVVLIVPKLEGSSIDLDNAILHNSLGSYQFIISGIVHNIDDSGLSGNSL